MPSFRCTSFSVGAKNEAQKLCFYKKLFLFFAVGRTFPYDKLSPIRPPTSLIGISQFSSILLQLALVAVFQFATVWMLHSQPWYVAKNGTENEAETDNDDYVCHDNYALFIIQGKKIL